jgi:ketosteroid isomerase-like protein
MQSEIQEIVEKINRAWAEDHVEDLARYFHENMVIVAPEFGGRLEGREACVESYREFTGRAKVNDLRLKDISIDVCGSTAVATYQFAVTYTMNDARHRNIGWDVFVFTHENDRWWATWRTMIIPGETA